MKYRGFDIVRGSYTGTTHDRADRWYIDWPDARLADRGHEGWLTLADARYTVDDTIRTVGVYATRMQSGIGPRGGKIYRWHVASTTRHGQGDGRTARQAAAQALGCDESGVAPCGRPGKCGAWFVRTRGQA